MKSIDSNWLYTVASFTVLGSLVSCQNARKEAQRPNIVYIMTDDHTAQMMSCYDTRYIETPNLDRIARGGVRFTNSFVTNSLSGPSRACMLTGKFSHKNGFTDNTTCKFDASQQTMPKLLQQAGYQTAIVGKWHLETLPTGFDFWEILPGQGDYYNPNFITQNNDTVHKRGYVTRIITDTSLDWLQNRRDREKPFCLFIHHKAIHRNWMADTCDLTLYEDREFSYPDNFFEQRIGAGTTIPTPMYPKATGSCKRKIRQPHLSKNSHTSCVSLHIAGSGIAINERVVEEINAPHHHCRAGWAAATCRTPIIAACRRIQITENYLT